jgi:hypothetical protein
MKAGERVPRDALARRSACALVLAAALLAACAGSSDIVPVSHDVVGNAGGSGTTPEGYDYVARRPLATIGLAEGRGLDPAVARAAVDRLADRLDACVTEQSRGGTPVAGAARVIAQIDAGGSVTATQVRIDPGNGGAASAALCLVAPLKILTFPPSDRDGRGIALEAIWGQVAARP